MEISKRKQDILFIIVEDYIKSAEPVSSKSVCDRLKVSSATVRNEMLDLENLGFLIKPHTSAGRIPSDLGYRFYVDNLLKNNENLPVNLGFINQFRGLSKRELDKLILDTSNLISDLTNYTSVASTPLMKKILIRKIDILFLDEKSFVLVFITDNNIIKNKMLKSSIPLYKEEIEQLAFEINELLQNVDIQEVTNEKLSFLFGKSHLSFLIERIIIFVSNVCQELLAQRIYLGGESNILNYPEFIDGAKAKDLIDFIKNPDMLKFSQTDNVNVRIGFENGNNPLSDASVVYATYAVGSGAYGVIGVVGPKRMDYQKVSAYLTLYARQLSKIIENSFLSDEEYIGGVIDE